jgi:hypothetical protein
MYSVTEPDLVSLVKLTQWEGELGGEEQTMGDCEPDTILCRAP